MAKIAGVDVLLKARNEGGTLEIIGGQTGASLSRSASTIDATDKTSAGWTTSMVGLKSWSVEAEGFVTLGNVGQELLETSFENREPVEVEIRIGATDDVDGITLSGLAVITSLENEFGQEDAVTFSVSLEGASPLTRMVGVVPVGP
jgi:TP901-1 family phage major tail protein